MKLFSLLCAAVVSLAALAPATASAYDSCERTRVTYECGRPVYWTYTCVGHASCGRPIMRWVVTSRGGHGGHGGHGYNSGYGGGRSCDSDRGYRYSRSRSRGGVSFHFSH